jgi:hypothetical protein
MLMLKKFWFSADMRYNFRVKTAAKRSIMADIIEFPKMELTSGERKRLKEFIRDELEDIQDTSCESYAELQDQFLVLAEYFQKFIAMVEDPATKLNLDLDFGLYLLEGRIRKIRGMIESLFEDEQGIKID